MNNTPYDIWFSDFIDIHFGFLRGAGKLRENKFLISLYHSGLSAKDASERITQRFQVPNSCKGVKCMQQGCENLASHKVGEQNLFNQGDGYGNNELIYYEMFNRRHELTTYLCDEHFSNLMKRDEKIIPNDPRFN